MNAGARIFAVVLTHQVLWCLGAWVHMKLTARRERL